MDPLEIAGLPLHPLIVHVVVVLLPLTALALVLAAVWPAARRRLGVAVPVAALVVLVLVPITIGAGETLKETVGPVPSVLHHEALGRMLPPWAVALFVVSALHWAWHRWRPARTSSERRRSDAVVSAALSVAAVVVAAGSTIMVVLIGEAGARSVWG